MNNEYTKWIWTCTKLIVVILTALYVANWIYSVVVIAIAIYHTGTFSYLDTLIAETNTTFREIVGVYLIKAGIENVFKNNNFGGFITRKLGKDIDAPACDDVSDINVEDISNL